MLLSVNINSLFVASCVRQQRLEDAVIFRFELLILPKMCISGTHFRQILFCIVAAAAVPPIFLMIKRADLYHVISLVCFVSLLRVGHLFAEHGLIRGKHLFDLG